VLKELKESLKKAQLNNDRPMRNFSHVEQESLINLLNRPKVVVIPSDKNLGPAIVDVSWYKQACLAHLKNATTYTEMTSEFDAEKCIAQLRDKVEGLADNFKLVLTDEEYKWITQTREFALMPFYITAKVHKMPVKGRPILPSKDWVMYNLSKVISSNLNQIVNKLPNVLGDSLDLIHILESDRVLCKQLKRTPYSNVWLISANVKVLYPNIPSNNGITTMQAVLQCQKCIPEQ
jgi:hypothetical protein